MLYIAEISAEVIYMGDYLENCPLFLELFDMYVEVLHASVMHLQMLYTEYLL
jgi:hypothetical protein